MTTKVSAKLDTPQLYSGEYGVIDVIRSIENKTTTPITIQDLSGRTRIYMPCAKHGETDNTIVISDWYNGLDTTGMIDYHPREYVLNVDPKTQDKDKDRVSRESDPHASLATGVRVTKAISIDDIAAHPKGAYFDNVNLVICAGSQTHTTMLEHPRVCPASKKLLQNATGTTVNVELLDPQCKYDTLYMNLNGTVYSVKPKRFPCPDQEGVLISTADCVSGKVEHGLFSVEDALNTAGCHGVRLYTTEYAAQEDTRHPNTAALLAEKESFNKEKETIIANAKQQVQQENDAIIKNLKINNETKTAALLRDAKQATQKQEDSKRELDKAKWEAAEKDKIKQFEELIKEQQARIEQNEKELKEKDREAEQRQREKREKIARMENTAKAVLAICGVVATGFSIYKNTTR